MKKIISIFVGLISVLLCGCAAQYCYHYSKPVASEAYEFFPNGIVLFRSQGIDLFVHPKNNTHSFDGGHLLFLPVPEDTASEQFNYSGRYFDVEIVVHSSKEGVTFNPKDVYLTSQDGKVFQSSKYLVKKGRAYWPLRKEPHNLLQYSAGDPNWEHEEISFDHNNFELSQDKTMWGIGFIIRFETPSPNPGIAFKLEIKGLQYQGQDIEMPIIEFKEQSIYRWAFT